MRLTRRSLLAGAGTILAGGFGAGRAIARPAAVEAPTAIVIKARPIALMPGDRERRRFGSLEFRGGLDLTCDNESFGGFSALWRSADGGRLVAVSDNAEWLTARVESRDGAPVGLADAVLAPILFTNGKPLRRTRWYDTEGLAMAGETAYVSVERHHAVLQFDFGRDGIAARGRRIGLPKEAEGLPKNTGLEALGVAPRRSPLAGALVAIAEESSEGSSAPTAGFILTGPRTGLFEVARRDDFDVSDLAFLPDGDLLILDRRISFLRGIGVRLRRIDGGAIKPGALVDGPVLYESDSSQSIDNFEGLSVHREAGTTVLTMISDDNFSMLQRTLLVEFALAA